MTASAGSPKSLLMKGTFSLLLAAAAVAVSSSEGDVFMQFYLDQVKLWNQQGQQVKLQAAILPGLQAFCARPVNFGTCGINATTDTNFTASNVVISPGYPANANSRYLNVRFTISYALNTTDVTLPAAVVTEIAQNQREVVSNAVGYHVIYINDIMYSVPPPTMANKVIVPMFVIGTIILIIVALALRRNQAKQHRKKLRNSGSEMTSKRKNSRTTGAVNGSSSNKVGASSTDLATAGSLPPIHQQRKEKSTGEVNEDKKKKKTKSKKKTSGVDWGVEKSEKENGSRDKSGEFNNIGFEKSINEGDPRARQTGGQSEGAVDPRASQSALSEVIQVRGEGDSTPEKLGKKKSSKKAAGKSRGKHPSSHGGGGGGEGGGAEKVKKSLSSSHSNKDSEEVMLMDGGVFNPPESNVSDQRNAGSDSDDVPTLRDSSDQQMI